MLGTPPCCPQQYSLHICGARLDLCRSAKIVFWYAVTAFCVDAECLLTRYVWRTCSAFFMSHSAMTREEGTAIPPDLAGELRFLLICLLLHCRGDHFIL